MAKVDGRTDRRRIAWRGPRPDDDRAGESREVDLHALGCLSLTGPGAEDAVRRLVIDALTRSDEHIEVIMDQADAEHLLEAGPEAEDRFPYLVITAGPVQTAAYLRTPGPYRLVVTTGDGTGLTGAEQATVVALAAGPFESAEVGADGRVAARSCGLDLPGRLPTMTLPEANARLMS